MKLFDPNGQGYWLNYHQAATLLSTSAQQVAHMVKTGQLPQHIYRSPTSRIGAKMIARVSIWGVLQGRNVEPSEDAIALTTRIGGDTHQTIAYMQKRGMSQSHWTLHVYLSQWAPALPTNVFLKDDPDGQPTSAKWRLYELPGTYDIMSRKPRQSLLWAAANAGNVDSLRRLIENTERAIKLRLNNEQ